jgi:hypothetical protein
VSQNNSLQMPTDVYMKVRVPFENLQRKVLNIQKIHIPEYPELTEDIQIEIYCNHRKLESGY